MSYFVVDVESDGEYPPDYSMVCFGAVRVDNDLATTFYGTVKPISLLYKPETLAISGFNRRAHEAFDAPAEVMNEFHHWLLENSIGKPTFISDNLAYDWQWINYYFHKYVGSNPFGFSGRRIGDLYCGLMKDAGVKPTGKESTAKRVIRTIQWMTREVMRRRCLRSGISWN
jgi:hypothetical protein